MHHPLRSAWITPTSYPVDEIRIMKNGLVKNQYICTTEKDMVIIRITDASSLKSNRPEETVLNAEWDTKITYHLPICDALESWEFVFSKKPIDEKMYLEGYVQSKLSENTFFCEKDLAESDERRKRYW